jgi:hypothetical protein
MNRKYILFLFRVHLSVLNWFFHKRIIHMIQIHDTYDTIKEILTHFITKLVINKIYKIYKIYKI